MRVVYYSVIDYKIRREQVLRSIRSLRRHNAYINVNLYLFDTSPEESLFFDLEGLDVNVVFQGKYTEFLRKHHTCGIELAKNPCYSKFLVTLPKDTTQALYLDCDTYFFRDVNQLFDECRTADFYAREEIHSRRSPSGYDPSYMDEDKLAGIAHGQGLDYVPPFNAGVVLMNNGLWRTIPQLGQLDYALKMGTRELPYPSSNEWIIDGLALGLALGSLPPSQFQMEFFSPSQVVMGAEYSRLRGIMAHYFSCLENRFVRYLEERK